MKNINASVILIGSGTHRLKEPTNQPIWYIFLGQKDTSYQNSREMRSCHFIPNKVLSFDACLQ